MRPSFRLFLLSECVVNPPPAPVAATVPLLGLFAPKLIELAIGGVATMLKKAGADHTERVSGAVFADLYVADRQQALQLNPRIGCLLGAYGEFPAQDADDSNHPAVEKLLKAGLIPVGSKVDVLFEAMLRPSADSTAFFLDMRHFSVVNFIRGGMKSQRSFIATLHLTTPSATADGDSIAIGNIDLGRLEKGADLIPMGHPLDVYPSFHSNLMPWRRIGEASKTAYNADVVATTATGRTYMPVCFNLTISETAEGNKFLQALGELLEGSKKETAAEIAKLILPEKRGEAEAERSAAAEKLYQDELDAEVLFREAQKLLAAASSPADQAILRVKLVAAERKRERAAAILEAAGLPARPAVP